MRTLHFNHAGKHFAASLDPDTLGHVTRYGEHRWTLPHPSWKTLGVSKHHASNRVTVPLTPDIDAKEILGGYVWDLDHGTTRQWGGQYQGRTPRITQAWITSN